LSTILKALKKLEAESPSEPGILAAPVGRHNRQPEKWKWFRSPFNVFLGAALMLGAGIFLFFKAASPLFVQESPVERRQSENQAVASGSRFGAGSSAVVREIVQPAGGAAPSVPDQAAEAEASGIEADWSFARSGAAEPESPEKRDARKTNPDVMVAGSSGNTGKSLENPAPAAGLRRQPADEKTPPTSSGAPVTLTVLADTGLQIQAISWNKDPPRRLAVINSRVCREGGHVSGYRIIRINPDDIVVSADGRRGKILF